MKGESIILSALMSAVGVGFLIVAVALVVISRPSSEEIAQDADGMSATAQADMALSSDGQRDAGAQEKTPVDAAVTTGDASDTSDASDAAEILADAAPLDGAAGEVAGNPAPAESDKLDGGAVATAAAHAPKPPLKAPVPPKKNPPPKPKGKKPR